MKKLLLLILTISCVLFSHTVSASDTVSRGECLTGIMKTIGLTDEYISKLDGADYLAFADTDPFSYFGCAMASGIAYGFELTVDSPSLRTSRSLRKTDFFFCPERPVTVGECLAFMTRCLETDSENDIVSSAKNAAELGLIGDFDSYLTKLDLPITSDEFHALLQKMLGLKRCKYYDGNTVGMRADIDNEGAMTYRELLEKGE